MKIFFVHFKYICLFFILTIFIFILFFKYTFSSSKPCNSYPKIVTSELKEKVNNIYDNTKKVAYLTFDDGPHPKVTPIVLDILKETNVKATFFVIGKQVKQYPDITKRAYDEGHYIANHSYSHNNEKLYKNSSSFKKEITDTDKQISKAIKKENYSSHLFRFPNGFMSPIYQTQKKQALQLLEKLDYTYLDWNALNKDSEQKFTSNQLFKNLKNSIKGKNSIVVLMHDTSDISDSSQILKESILYLKQQGYIFKNFYDILNQSKEPF